MFFRFFFWIYNDDAQRRAAADKVKISFPNDHKNWERYLYPNIVDMAYSPASFLTKIYENLAKSPIKAILLIRTASRRARVLIGCENLNFILIIVLCA